MTSFEEKTYASISALKAATLFQEARILCRKAVKALTQETWNLRLAGAIATAAAQVEAEAAEEWTNATSILEEEIANAVKEQHRLQEICRVQDIQEALQDLKADVKTQDIAMRMMEKLATIAEETAEVTGRTLEAVRLEWEIMKCTGVEPSKDPKEKKEAAEETKRMKDLAQRIAVQAINKAEKGNRALVQKALQEMRM